MLVHVFHEAWPVLSDEWEHGVDALLQMAVGKCEAGEGGGVARRLLIPGQNLHRSLARNLRHLILDLAAAGRQRFGLRDIEAPEVTIEGVQRAGYRRSRRIEALSQRRGHEARGQGFPEFPFGPE